MYRLFLNTVQLTMFKKDIVLYDWFLISPGTTYYPPRPLPGAGIRSTFIYYCDVTDYFTVKSPLTHLCMITSSICYLTINYIHVVRSLILVFFFGLCTLVWVDEYIVGYHVIVLWYSDGTCSGPEGAVCLTPVTCPPPGGRTSWGIV